MLSLVFYVFQKEKLAMRLGACNFLLAFLQMVEAWSKLNMIKTEF